MLAKCWTSTEQRFLDHPLSKPVWAVTCGSGCILSFLVVTSGLWRNDPNKKLAFLNPWWPCRPTTAVYLGLPMSSVHSFPHSLSQVHFCLTSLQASHSPERSWSWCIQEGGIRCASGVGPGIRRRGCLAEDGWCRSRSHGLLPVQSVACFPHFMIRAEFYFPIKTHLWSASIYKQTAITRNIPDFIWRLMLICSNYILHMWCLAPEQRAHLSYRVTGCTFSSMVVATMPGL